MTWKESIIYILQNNKLNEEYRPMHYRDITNSIIEQKLRDKYGQTPADTVNAQLTTDKLGLFESLGNGEYRLTDAGKRFVIQNATDKLKPKDDSNKNKDINNVQTSHTDISQKLIRIYGMFWMREGINWSHNPKLLGVQSTGASPIDLSEMRGIYICFTMVVRLYMWVKLQNNLFCNVLSNIQKIDWPHAGIDSHGLE